MVYVYLSPNFALIPLLVSEKTSFTDGWTDGRRTLALCCAVAQSRTILKKSLLNHKITWYSRFSIEYLWQMKIHT